MQSLTDRLKIAIATSNIPLLGKLIKVCDKLHAGQECDGFKPEDIPSDELYEQAKRKYEEAKAAQAEAKAITKSEAKEKHLLSDLHMAQDAIIKSPEVKLEHITVICMPKYDGVSCTIRFVLNEETNMFEVEAAVTRGTDIGTSHKNTDVKDRIIPMLMSDTCPWFAKRFHSFRKYYKQVTVRGEIVLVTKDIKPAAPYVAGKVNSKAKVIDTDGVIGFKMFEITRLIDHDGNVTIPTQKRACSLITQIDRSIPVVIKELADSTSNTTDFMRLFNTWSESLDSPIDGIVYCQPDWRYPATESETHGVDYGKYALKPNVSAQTTFEDVEYTIAKDGRITPILHFKQIVIEGKKYAKATSSIEEINNYIKYKNLHKGSVVTVTLQASIIPKVTDVVYEEGDAIYLPKRCLVCHSKLVLKEEKTITLYCPNSICPGALIKQLENLLRTLNIEGFAKKTIIKILGENDNDYLQLFQAIDAKKGKGFSQRMIRGSTVSNLLIALNLATKTSLNKIPNLYPIRDNKVMDHLVIIREELSRYDSILVSMVMEYI